MEDRTPGDVKARCYLPPEDWEAREPVLGGREAHHLIHVLRVRPGTPLSLFNGAGGEATALVSSITKREVALRIEKRREVPPPQTAISLGMAVPKHGKFEEIIDQATQLGVSEILPLATERGVVRLSGAEAEKKLDRWRQVAIAAAKQCEVSHLPQIAPMSPFKSLLGRFPEFQRVLLAAVEGPHEPLENLLKGSPRRVLILVGPEGDFTPQEVETACVAGARRFSLGSTILRCETAAVVSLGLVSYVLDSKR